MDNGISIQSRGYKKVADREKQLPGKAPEPQPKPVFTVQTKYGPHGTKGGFECYSIDGELLRLPTGHPMVEGAPLFLPALFPDPPPFCMALCFRPPQRSEW